MRGGRIRSEVRGELEDLLVSEATFPLPELLYFAAWARASLSYYSALAVGLSRLRGQESPNGPNLTSIS